MNSRQLIFALFLCFIAVGTSACVPATKVVRRYEVKQQALVPAPGAPEAYGKLEEPGKSFVQGGVTWNQVNRLPDPKDKSQTGQLTPRVGAHVRMGSGGEQFESSVSFRYHNAALSTSSDGQPVEDSAQFTTHSFWAGIQGRALLFGTRKNGLALGGEGAIGNIPFRRLIKTETTKEYSYLKDKDGNPIRTTTVDYENQVENDLGIVLRGNFQAFVSPLDDVTLTVGAQVQSHPRYWGSRVVGEACKLKEGLMPGQPVLDVDSSYDCKGDTPDDLEHNNTVGIGTLFVGGSLMLSESLSVHGIVFSNLFGTPIITDALPYGASGSVRFSF